MRLRFLAIHSRSIVGGRRRAGERAAGAAHMCRPYFPAPNKFMLPDSFSDV